MPNGYVMEEKTTCTGALSGGQASMATALATCNDRTAAGGSPMCRGIAYKCTEKKYFPITFTDSTSAADACAATHDPTVKDEIEKCGSYVLWKRAIGGTDNTLNNELFGPKSPLGPHAGSVHLDPRPFSIIVGMKPHTPADATDHWTKWYEGGSITTDLAYFKSIIGDDLAVDGSAADTDELNYATVLDSRIAHYRVSMGMLRPIAGTAASVNKIGGLTTASGNGRFQLQGASDKVPVDFSSAKIALNTATTDGAACAWDIYSTATANPALMADTTDTANRHLLGSTGAWAKLLIEDTFGATAHHTDATVDSSTDTRICRCPKSVRKTV